jgi:agmatine deiminase
MTESFRMPAEWEPHEATWLTWPHDEAHWPGKFEKIPPIWARMVKELEAGEEVHILIHDAPTRDSAVEAMNRAGVVGRRVHLHQIPNNFAWARDHGPIFVKDAAGKVILTHWKYNAWGGKWAYDLDDDVPIRMSEALEFRHVDVPMVLEGGSIDVNGLGTLLTTESCLLNRNRNPGMTRDQIEQRLCEYLGVRKILWLGEGIAGDDTDGHVDDLTRFVGPRTVVTVIEPNRSDANYRPLFANLRRLQKATDQDEKTLEVIDLKLPKPIIYKDDRLPASYANFYVGNEVVLLPIFRDANDRAAVETLEKAFPSRRVVPIDATDLIWGLGAFHCVTQQQPKR